MSDYFGLDADAARDVVREVAAVTKRWRAEATRTGLAKRDIARLESAFDHDDLRFALKL